MVRDNCIDTLPGIGLSASVNMSLTWRGWLQDGKRLIVHTLMRAVAGIKACDRNARSRRQLAALDADQLADVGISRDQAYRATRGPLWLP